MRSPPPARRSAGPTGRAVGRVLLVPLAGLVLVGVPAGCRAQGDSAGAAAADPWVLTWAYDGLEDFNAQSDVGQSGAGGVATPILLDEPGPWGTRYAIDVQFDTAPPWGQPQAGAWWRLPEPVEELWIQGWIQFDTNWTTEPEWENPPGTPTGNLDHKTLFIYEEGFVTRWEFKWGVWGDGMYASAAAHDVQYAEYWDPPFPYPIQGDWWEGQQAHKRAYPRGQFSARRDAWDGEWHEFRIHARIGDAEGGGAWEIWHDGVKVIDAQNVASNSQGRRFFQMVFGANRNSGPREPMGFRWGEIRVYRTPPADWPD